MIFPAPPTLSAHQKRMIILIVWSILPTGYYAPIPRIILFLYGTYSALHLSSILTWRSLSFSVRVTSALAARGIEAGSGYLDTLSRFKPTGFSFSGPVMVFAASTGPRGYQSDGQRGFNQTKDTSNSDDEGDDGEHDKSDRNEPVHTGKNLWNRVLEKYQELDARLRQLEHGKEAALNDSQRS